METPEAQPAGRRVQLPALEQSETAGPHPDIRDESPGVPVVALRVEPAGMPLKKPSRNENLLPADRQGNEREDAPMIQAKKAPGGGGREYPYAAPMPVAKTGTMARFRPKLNFKLVKLAQLLCVGYIMILTFSPAPIGLVDPDTGFIVDTANSTNTENGAVCDGDVCRPVVAKDALQMACLAVSRASAFSLYPAMILVFLSKCKATLNLLGATRAALYISSDMHKLHHFCGHYIAFDVLIHTLFHLVRWGAAGNISLLWTHVTGISGLIVVTATPLITIPMLYLRKSINYEIRKLLHYLFYVFSIGICFHVPPQGVPNGGFLPYVLGFCIALYFLDFLYIELRMTEEIETTAFQVLPSGVQMTMDVSPRFQSNGVAGGYAYVCIPWVDRNQWHAFSLFEDPDRPLRRQVFMQKGGDWTSLVHESLQTDTVRPVWVRGPFLSPYKAAALYDNHVLVASGIGITPALSVIRAHKATRRVNLIWAVRDPHMLEFFLDRFELDNNGWNLIFYTGKEPLNPILEELHINIRIIKMRPNLHSVIPNIIYSIESKKALPELTVQLSNGTDVAEVEAGPQQTSRPGRFTSSLSAKVSRSLSTKVSRRKSRLEVLKSINARYEVSFEVFDSTPEEDSNNQAFVAALSPAVKARWGILYCGGSKPVEDALSSISGRYKISLDTESFAW